MQVMVELHMNNAFMAIHMQGSVPEVEETMPAVTGDGILPLPGLLKGWKMETRQRPNGSRDKVR